MKEETILIGLIILIIILYLIVRPRKSEKIEIPQPLKESAEVAKNDIGWVRFIKGYLVDAKNKQEKDLIERMLADIEARGLKTDVVDSWRMDDAPATNPTTAIPVPVYEPPAPEKTRAQLQLDNASLLLYFGAFLFVASAGLFVAFGGLDGTLRTLIVLLVSFALYMGGMIIFTTRPRFKQAGLAFVGIGMSIAPLIGLAAYTYIFDKQNGSVVWLGTSVLCLAMYTHALLRLRAPLLNYILIFTFLSLFESSVSIIHLPIYYFGWMLAAVGIGLLLIARLRGVPDDFRESSSTSGQIFLPIALIGSLMVVPAQGVEQFGISLLFAAAYYGLQALATEQQTQQANAAVAHISALTGIATLWYGATRNAKSTAVLLLVAGLIQLVVVLMATPYNVLARNFASVMLVAQFSAILFGVQSASVVLAALAACVVTAALVAAKQTRTDAYVLAAVSWVALPAVYGFYYAQPTLSANAVVLLSLAATLVQLCVLLPGKKALAFLKDGTAQYTYVFLSAAVVVAGFFASPLIAFMTPLIVGLSYIALDFVNGGDDWGVAAGIVVSTPLLLVSHSHVYFLLATLIALLINIFIALKNRSEANRWMSAGLWLILPVACGFVGHWGFDAYSWSYIVAMAGLIFSRAIARGVVLVSQKITVDSYARNTSYSYVVGYCTAAAVAVGLSLNSDNSRLHTSLILGALSVALLIISRVVEKRSDILLLLPILLQAVLLSALRPNGLPTHATLLTGYLFASIVLSLVFYFILPETYKRQETLVALRTGALATIWIAPLSYVFLGATHPMMIIGLATLSLLYAYHFRNESQATKELSLSGVAVAIMWGFGYAGIHEVQAYVHVLIALFACYAYWRHVRGDKEGSDQYVYTTLLVATVPLGLQALNGVAGGLYGWWLLLEQVFILIIGMSIQNKIVIKWGLYVSVGAVILQLRDLGWAALSVLALFLIGLAVYKIQKNVDK